MESPHHNTRTAHSGDFAFKNNSGYRESRYEEFFLLFFLKTFDWFITEKLKILGDEFNVGSTSTW